MKMSAKRYAIVRATSASSFETQLNETLDYLIEQNPTVTFSETGDYMTARIEYTAEVEVPGETGLPPQAVSISSASSAARIRSFIEDTSFVGDRAAGCSGDSAAGVCAGEYPQGTDGAECP